jgi:2,3-bisphosphoglycerate-dependent phosphoglycerate mutase
VKKGERLIIVAHGNSLRSLVMHLDNLSKEAVLELNIPTGVPLVYEFDADAKPVSHRYL